MFARFALRFVVLGVILASLLSACDSASAPAALGNDSIAAIYPAVKTGTLTGTLDSTPNPDGSTIYLIATGSKGQGIFSVPGAGGAATELVSGAPLVGPRSIASATDGQRVYIADPLATVGGGKPGVIFMLPVGGGTPTVVNGTQGSGARGLEVGKENGADVIVFAGIDPADGQPAVLKIPAAGATAPSIVFKGAQISAPDSIALSKTGAVYVSDRGAGGNGLGAVFRINGKIAEKVADQMMLGNPGGITLSDDGKIMLISAIDRSQGTDQVLLINLDTKDSGVVTTYVSQFHAAGGVHYAYNANFFSWADVVAGPQGGRVKR